MIPVFYSSYRIPCGSPSPLRQQKIQQLAKDMDGILADKIRKQKLKKKKKTSLRHKRFRKLYRISGNNTKTFYKHVSSRAHKTPLENKKIFLVAFFAVKRSGFSAIF